MQGHPFASEAAGLCQQTRPNKYSYKLLHGIIHLHGSHMNSLHLPAQLSLLYP